MTKIIKNRIKSIRKKMLPPTQEPVEEKTMKYYITRTGKEFLKEDGDPFDVAANERKVMVAKALAAQKFDLEQTKLAKERGVKSSTKVPRRDRMFRKKK